MIEAKFIPMETEYPYAPGAHQDAIRKTAGQTEEYAQQACGNTFDSLCDNCRANHGKAKYTFELTDTQTGRTWKKRTLAYSIKQARETLTNWGGRKNLKHVY